jgi:hypothetical protein
LILLFSNITPDGSIRTFAYGTGFRAFIQLGICLEAGSNLKRQLGEAFDDPLQNAESMAPVSTLNLGVEL